MRKFKTYNVTPKDINKKWYLIDAEGEILGRVAEKAAYIIRGKHKAIYTPYLDTGDNVIIINAEKAYLSANKKDTKVYYKHTGYPGGLKSQTYSEMLEKDATKPMEKAVKGMLPNGPLGRELFRNLRVYAGSDYNEVSQKPESVKLSK